MATKAELEQSLLEKENEVNDLKSQFEQMKQMMQQLMSQQPQTQYMQQSNLDEEYIQVMSLCPTCLILSPTGSENDLYIFEEYGEVQEIPFQELRKIVSRQKKLTKEGYFYILNKEAIKKLRIDNYYDDLLDDKAMMELFTKNSKEFMDVYRMLPHGQRVIINDIIIQKKKSNDYVDVNILFNIDREFGTHLVEYESPEEVLKKLEIKK